MKLKESLIDYWEIVFSFINALIVAYDSAVRFLQLGWITDELVSSACTLLFIVFGCLGIWKFVRKGREAEKTTKVAVEKMEVAERQFKELQIAYATQGKELEAIKNEVGTTDRSLVGNQINNSTINIGEDKKKDDESETTFPRTFHHNEFHIKKDSAQNILNFIKNDISSGFWFTGNGDKDSYHVNHKETRFFYLGKNNAPTDGIYFSVIKNGKHFPNFFWISIISTGIGENILLTLNFETQEKDAVEFFGILKKKLAKHFTIWEPGIAGAW
jgi:hypothetical protein